jgi:hypothetical protein
LGLFVLCVIAVPLERGAERGKLCRTTVRRRRRTRDFQWLFDAVLLRMNTKPSWKGPLNKASFVSSHDGILRLLRGHSFCFVCRGRMPSCCERRTADVFFSSFHPPFYVSGAIHLASGTCGFSKHASTPSSRFRDAYGHWRANLWDSSAECVVCVMPESVSLFCDGPMQPFSVTAVPSFLFQELRFCRCCQIACSVGCLFPRVC